MLEFHYEIYSLIIAFLERWVVKASTLSHNPPNQADGTRQLHVMHRPLGTAWLLLMHPQVLPHVPGFSSDRLNKWSQPVDSGQTQSDILPFRTALYGRETRSPTAAAAASAYLQPFRRNPNKRYGDQRRLPSDTLAQKWCSQTISPATRNQVLVQASNPTLRLTLKNQQYMFPHMVTLRALLVHQPVRLIADDTMFKDGLLTTLAEDKPPGSHKHILIVLLLKCCTRLLYPNFSRQRPFVRRPSHV